jgi:preprotein translocase subunit SecD
MTQEQPQGCSVQFILLMLMALFFGVGQPGAPISLPQAVPTATPGTAAVLQITLEPDVPTGTFTFDDVQAAEQVISARLGRLGYSDSVHLLENDQILVEVPADADQSVVLDAVQRVGLLELVDFTGLSDRANDFIGHHILTTGQRVEVRLVTPEATEEAPLVNPLTSQPFETILTNSAIQGAQATFTNNQWVVEFQFTAEGGQTFGAYTAAHIGQPVAIVLDGAVISAPIIRAQLTTGGQIIGSFTEQRAKDLALDLTYGALPFPLTVLSVETVNRPSGS